MRVYAHRFTAEAAEGGRTAESAEDAEDGKMRMHPYRRVILLPSSASSAPLRGFILPSSAPSAVNEMDINYCSGQVVDAAMKVHSALGPGLLESAYQACLAHELRKRGLAVRAQLPVPIIYDGVRIELGYRIDLVVEDAVVVELKAVANVLPIHEAQLLSHLKLSGHRVGLLINFHVQHLKDGIKRMVNNF